MAPLGRLPLILTFLLLAAIAMLRIPPTWRAEPDQETTLLLFNSVHRKATLGMSATLAYPSSMPWESGPPAAEWHTPDGRLYRKQVGLQMYVLGAIVPTEPSAMLRTLHAARYVAAGLTALVMTLLIGALARHVGAVAAGAAIVLAALNGMDVFQFFAHSLYWLPWLSLLPLLVVLRYYRADDSPARLRAVQAACAAAVCLKALCGYEHVSVIVLGLAAGIVLAARPAPWRKVIAHAGQFVAAGAVGVVVALTAHAALLYLAEGSLDAVLENTVVNAARRSFGGHEKLQLEGGARAHLIGIYRTLAHHKVTTVLQGVWGLTALVVAARLWRTRALEETRETELVRSLLVASGIALAASWSWLVLMRTHVIIAPRYNGLTPLLSFMWFAAPFIAVSVQWLRGAPPPAAAARRTSTRDGVPGGEMPQATWRTPSGSGSGLA